MRCLVAADCVMGWVGVGVWTQERIPSAGIRHICRGEVASVVVLDVLVMRSRPGWVVHAGSSAVQGHQCCAKEGKQHFACSCIDSMAQNCEKGHFSVHIHTQQKTNIIRWNFCVDITMCTLTDAPKFMYFRLQEINMSVCTHRTSCMFFVALLWTASETRIFDNGYLNDMRPMFYHMQQQHLVCGW